MKYPDNHPLNPQTPLEMSLELKQPKPPTFHPNPVWLSDEQLIALASESGKQAARNGSKADTCEKCGSHEFEVKIFGETGCVGDVVCQKCNHRLRSWNAY